MNLTAFPQQLHLARREDIFLRRRSLPLTGITKMAFETTPLLRVLYRLEIESILSEQMNTCLDIIGQINLKLILFFLTIFFF